jgi:dTDP-glucose 4,6-dehydratase
MRILVTGGAGFIGSNYVRLVLAEHPEDTVVVFDKLTYAGRRETLADVERHPRFAFIQGDVCDGAAVDAAVKDADAVVHFAAETHVDRSLQDAAAFLRTNIEGTWTLLDACRRHGKRFHHVSTDEVYGALRDSDPPFTEATPYDPRSPYSASKAASDHLVRAAFHSFGVAATVSHCSNNYGPFCFPEKFIPLAVTRLIQGGKVPVYGDGMNVRDWIYVEDHCRGVDAALRRGRPGETYDFGGRSERANIEVVLCLLAEFGVGIERIAFVRDRAGHDRRYAIDAAKAQRELDWAPRVPFLHGLRKTVAWYRAHEAWWRPLLKDVPADPPTVAVASTAPEPVPVSVPASAPVPPAIPVAPASPRSEPVPTAGPRLGDLSQR